MPALQSLQRLRAGGCVAVCMAGLALLCTATSLPYWHTITDTPEIQEYLGVWIRCQEYPLGPQEDSSEEDSKEEGVPLPIGGESGGTPSKICKQIAYEFSGDLGSLVWASQGLQFMSLLCGVVGLVAALVWLARPVWSAASLVATIWTLIAGLMGACSLITFVRFLHVHINVATPNGYAFWLGAAGDGVLVAGGLLYTVWACWLSKTPLLGQTQK